LTIKIVQAGLLALYRVVTATGVLNTPWGRSLYEASYWLYKSRYEAGPVQWLRKWVRPKTVVIDVGANIGFFTLHFASWVSEGGKVLAIEPEAVNYARLQRNVSRSGFAAVVDAVNAAAADAAGEALLELNPLHPGDHKLGTTGVAVATITLDHLLAARGWPEVSLIKIDVQGAEMRVLAGARETIPRFRPALFVEVEDQKLRRYGSSASELITRCTGSGYTIHTLAEDALAKPLTAGEALALVEAKGYTDLLLLPAEHVTGPARGSSQPP
jgi:FkbM family methyltransferase